MVAGCSSGGDGGQINDLTADVSSLEEELETTKAALTKAQSDLEAARTQLATATTERNTARTQLATVRADLTMTQEDLDEAETDLATANSALSTARSALSTAETQVTTLTTQLATATGQVTTLTGQLTSTQSENTSLESQVEQAETQLTEAEQENLRARVTEYLDDSDPVLEIASSDVKTATVMWRRGGSLQFTPQGAYTSTSAPSVPGGWSRSGGFTSRSGTQTSLRRDTAYLYSNIESPGTRAWWKVHGLLETLTIDADLEMLARGSSARPNADTDTTTDGHQYDMLTVSGSLGGVSGRFTCSGCSGTVGDDANGIDVDVTFVQGRPRFTVDGNWTFERTGSVTSGYQVDRDDAFLYFGIWASEPDEVSGNPMFQYIAGGGAESGTDLANFNALTGTATFTGGAIGKYATQGQVGQQNASIGTFTATATFTVNFGTEGGTPAAGAAGNVHGRITSLQENGTALTGWSVTLGAAADVAMAADITNAAATGGTVASIGGVPAGGAWGASFYGSDNVVLPDRVLYPEAQYPVVDLAGLAGWFEATSDTAGLAGAFAATP